MKKKNKYVRIENAGFVGFMCKTSCLLFFPLVLGIMKALVFVSQCMVLGIVFMCMSVKRLSL